MGNANATAGGSVAPEGQSFRGHFSGGSGGGGGCSNIEEDDDDQNQLVRVRGLPNRLRRLLPGAGGGELQKDAQPTGATRRHQGAGDEAVAEEEVRDWPKRRRFAISRSSVTRAACNASRRINQQDTTKRTEPRSYDRTGQGRGGWPLSPAASQSKSGQSIEVHSSGPVGQAGQEATPATIMGLHEQVNDARNNPPVGRRLGPVQRAARPDAGLAGDYRAIGEGSEGQASGSGQSGSSSVNRQEKLKARPKAKTKLKNDDLGRSLVADETNPSWQVENLECQGNNCGQLAANGRAVIASKEPERLLDEIGAGEMGSESLGGDRLSREAQSAGQRSAGSTLSPSERLDKSTSVGSPPASSHRGDQISGGLGGTKREAVAVAPIVDPSDGTKSWSSLVDTAIERHGKGRQCSRRVDVGKQQQQGKRIRRFNLVDGGGGEQGGAQDVVGRDDARSQRDDGSTWLPVVASRRRRRRASDLKTATNDHKDEEQEDADDDDDGDDDEEEHEGDRDKDKGEKGNQVNEASQMTKDKRRFLSSCGGGGAGTGQDSSSAEARAQNNLRQLQRRWRHKQQRYGPDGGGGGGGSSQIIQGTSPMAVGLNRSATSFYLVGGPICTPAGANIVAAPPDMACQSASFGRQSSSHLQQQQWHLFEMDHGQRVRNWLESQPFTAELADDTSKVSLSSELGESVMGLDLDLDDDENNNENDDDLDEVNNEAGLELKLPGASHQRQVSETGGGGGDYPNGTGNLHRARHLVSLQCCLSYRSAGWVLFPASTPLADIN